MKYPGNIREVAALKPDYMGFIFYQGSKRHFSGNDVSIPESIKKTGVFVNETVGNMRATARAYNLKALQLHGDESPEVCRQLKEELNMAEVIKAFAVDKHFDFQMLQAYEPFCDYFLFDTKGKERGGNGTRFDWSLLEGYGSDKPFFLSGGIGMGDIAEVRSFLKNQFGRNCYCIDVNSKFETEPGSKKVEELRNFIEILSKEK